MQQQDSAPCQTSWKSQKWLPNNFFNLISLNMRLHSSLDCGAMDYFLCGVNEKDTNLTSCNTETNLITRVKTAFSLLSRYTVKTSFDRFRNCMKALVDAEGSYFE